MVEILAPWKARGPFVGANFTARLVGQVRFLLRGPGSFLDRLHYLKACRVRCCYCGARMNWAIPTVYYSVGLNGFNCGCWRDPVE